MTPARHPSLAHLRPELLPDPRLGSLSALRRTSPMLDAVIDEVRGRRIRVGGHWLADFASCNYLGLDLDPEIAAAIGEQVARWGTHPSWSRLLGNPALYPLIEQRLTELVGRLLWNAGIYVTLAAYPLVPRAEVGFRVQLTAANADDEVDELLAAISALAERSLLRTGPAAA